MSTVLQKAKLLEQYVSADQDAVDAVVELTLDKLLEREPARLSESRAALIAQLKDFESHYGMTTTEFVEQFDWGALGDATDYTEWSATAEMANRVQERIDLLSHAPAS